MFLLKISRRYICSGGSYSFANQRFHRVAAKAADCIEDMMCAAGSNLSAFKHEPILEALKLSPDGVETQLFRDVKNEGADLAESTQVSDARQAIKEISTGSQAYRKARIELWKPKPIP